MKNIPNKIYINIGDDKDKNTNFKDIKHNVTWRENKMFDNDIEYWHDEYIKNKLYNIYEKLNPSRNFMIEFFSNMTGKSPDEIENAFLDYIKNNKRKH